MKELKQPQPHWQLLPPVVEEARSPATETEELSRTPSASAADEQSPKVRTTTQRWQIVPPIVTETRLAAVKIERKEQAGLSALADNRLPPSASETDLRLQIVQPPTTSGRFRAIATDELPRPKKTQPSRNTKKQSRAKPRKPIPAIASLLILLGVLALSIFRVFPQRFQQHGSLSAQTPGSDLSGTPANGPTIAAWKGSGTSGTPSASPGPSQPQGPLVVKVPPAGEPYSTPVPATSLGYPASDGDVRWDGGFETGDFSQYWLENWGDLDGGGWGNSSGTLVTSPVRHGSYSLKMTVNPPDSSGAANRGQITTTNAQIGATEGNSFYYSFSLYIPSQPNRASGWPAWTNISQWFAWCYPMLQLFINSAGQYVVESQPNDPSACNGNGPTQEWVIGKVTYDTWEDFTFHISWSASPSRGSVTVWHDGKLVLPTQHVQTLENNAPGWDLQIYRDGGNTNVIYFAGVHVHTAYTPD
jgi:hypothetical protein